MIVSSESDGPAIGDWELARNVAEWLEIVAIVIIAVTVVVAGVQMARRLVGGDRARTQKPCSSAPSLTVSCSVSTS
jgi:hypothetical protein